MDIPQPNPRTLPLPLPAVYKSDKDMYGAFFPTVRATDAGYKLAPGVQDSEMVDEKHAFLPFVRSYEERSPGENPP